jgi:hypothetical protein
MGSADCIKTTGIVWVAALAASAPFVLSNTTITDTGRRTNSAINVVSWSFRPCAHRYSIVTFLFCCNRCLSIAGESQRDFRGSFRAM